MRQRERQKRHVACTLVAAVALVVVAALGFDSRAAQPASGAQTTKLQVTARVAAFFRLRLLYQAQAFTITQLDIDRGYVEVPAASRFAVITNSLASYVVDFRPLATFFESVSINGLGAPSSLSASGGSIVANAPQERSVLHQLSYYFVLRPGTPPGNYAWPLALAVHPM
jgi:hypothetical protein